MREILRGKKVDSPDQRGLLMRNVRVEGRLDLENVTTTLPVDLRDCTLQDGVNVSGAQIPSLILDTCTVGADDASEPALDAERLKTSYLSLNGTSLVSAAGAGTVNLRNSRLGYASLNEGRVTNTVGPAVAADGMHVEGSMHLTGGFTAVGASKTGTVRFPSVRIGTLLDLSGADIANSDGPALNAGNLNVGQDMFMRDEFEATGAGRYGAVRLTGAFIGGQLMLVGSITNESGPAFSADRLEVKHSMLMRDGFAASGEGSLGAVRMFGARLGRLECDGATITNSSGPALNAETLRVDGDVFLRDGFLAEAAGESGGVRLCGAQLGALDCGDATIRNSKGPAIDADGLEVGQGVSMHLEAVGAGGEGVLKLGGARVGGSIDISWDKVHNSSAQEVLGAVDGLVYSGIPAGGLDKWLELIGRRTPEYAAQPYQQLASVYRAAGHDGEVRRILISQRRDQIRREAITGRVDRVWARFIGLSLGYGYQPWRALVGLMMVLVVAVGIAYFDKTSFRYSRTAANPGAACSTVDRIGVGLDLSLPLFRSPNRTQCEFVSRDAGDLETVAYWTLQLFAWALATLFVVGFTGAIRKA